MTSRGWYWQLIQTEQKQHSTYQLASTWHEYSILHNILHTHHPTHTDNVAWIYRPHHTHTQLLSAHHTICTRVNAEESKHLKGCCRWRQLHRQTRCSIPAGILGERCPQEHNCLELLGLLHTRFLTFLAGTMWCQAKTAFKSFQNVMLSGQSHVERHKQNTRNLRSEQFQNEPAFTLVVAQTCYVSHVITAATK